MGIFKDAKNYSESVIELLVSPKIFFEKTETQTTKERLKQTAAPVLIIAILWSFLGTIILDYYGAPKTILLSFPAELIIYFIGTYTNIVSFSLILFVASLLIKTPLPPQKLISSLIYPFTYLAIFDLVWQTAELILLAFFSLQTIKLRIIATSIILIVKLVYSGIAISADYNLPTKKVIWLFIVSFLALTFFAIVVLVFLFRILGAL